MSQLPKILIEEVDQQMRERMEWMVIKPNVVVNYSGLHPIDTQVITDHCVDLIFANLVLPTQANLEQCIVEWRRLLKPGGLLMFSSLGPDTLKAWRDHYQQPYLPTLTDMHDVGDALLQLGLGDPVLDVDYLTLSYRDADRFHEELSIKAHPGENGEIRAVYEVVYGHAWGVASSSPEHRFSINDLRKTLSAPQ